jgi:hypothetical protein
LKLTIKWIALLEQLYFTYYNNKPKNAQKVPHRVQTWLGYHIWTIKTKSQDSQIHLFFHFSHDVLYFTLFFNVKWNNFVPNFMSTSKISIVFNYRSGNGKIYPMWAMFNQWPKIPKKMTFWNFLHYNSAFGFVTFMHFIHIST